MAITDKTIADKLLKIASQMQSAYDKAKSAFVEGKEAEYNRFWDTFQMNGERTNYSFAFSYSQAWFNENYNPKYAIKADGSVNMFSYNSVLTSTKVPIQATITLSNMFTGCTALKEIVSLSVTEDAVFSKSFDRCPSLETLNIQGTIGQNGFNVQWSTLLTHDSLMSIVNALEDKSGDKSGTTWLVTLGDENLAKLTAEEIALIANKGWNYA